MKKLIPFSFLAALLLIASFSGLPTYFQQKWTGNTPANTASKDTLTNFQDTTAAFVQYHDVEFFPAKHDEAALQQARMRMDSADLPIDLAWTALKDVKFKRKYIKEHEQEFEFPVFGAKIKSLNGKKVAIKGYIIPINKGLYALSKNPYAACFFCGGAGPETIMGIVFRHIPKTYKTDTFVTLKGVLKLNDTDFEQLMYQLMAAEAVK